MRRWAAVLLGLMMMTLAGCQSTAPASSSMPPPTSQSRTDGLKTYYLKGISYDIPSDWDKESAVQGTHHIAPDGGMVYVNKADFPYHKLSEAEDATAAMDETLLYVQATMPDYRLIKEEPLDFLGCHGREVWYQITLDGQKAAMFTLLLANKTQVYNLTFTVSSPDVETAMPGIIRSVQIG